MPAARQRPPGSTRRPCSTAGDGGALAQDLDEEHRRAVHEHQVAGLADADAERLRPGVDGAGAHRGARRQPGRRRGRRRHPARRPRRPGQPRAPARPARRRRTRAWCQRRARCRRAGRTDWPCGGRARTRRSAAAPRTSWACTSRRVRAQDVRARGGAARASLGPTACVVSGDPAPARGSRPRRSSAGQLVDLVGGPRVDPVEDRGPHRASSASASSRQGPTPLTQTAAIGHRRRTRAVNSASDRGNVPPPDRLGVHLRPARVRASTMPYCGPWRGPAASGDTQHALELGSRVALPARGAQGDAPSVIGPTAIVTSPQRCTVTPSAANIAALAASARSARRGVGRVGHVEVVGLVPGHELVAARRRAGRRA